LYRGGRTSDALSHYQHVRRQLTDELGIEPGLALQELHRQVLAKDPAVDVPSRGRRPGGAVTPHQLPAPPSVFVGRCLEFDRLSAASATGGIVLVSGSGGIGKSWLALYWAHSQLHRFPDGQLFVN